MVVKESEINMLLDACRAGDLATVEAQIPYFVSADNHNAEDLTPLQVASAANQSAIVDYLIRAGADLNLCNEFGWTPCIHAAYHGNLSILIKLHRAGANLELPSYLGGTILAIASGQGHEQIVQYLIEQRRNHSSEHNEEADEVGILRVDEGAFMSPFMAAVMNGHSSVAKLLMKRGADTQWSSSESELTNLMIACLSGNVDVTEALIKSEAVTSSLAASCSLVTSCNGDTAGSLAHPNTRHLILPLLAAANALPGGAGKRGMAGEGNADGKGNIFTAIANKEWDRVKEMIPTAEGVAVEKDTGRTALMAVAAVGRFDLVQLLVNSRKDIMDRQDREKGWTALMMAIHNNKPGVANLLLAAGANPNVTDKQGQTAFDIATQANAGREMLSALVSRMRQVNAAASAARANKHNLPASGAFEGNSHYRSNGNHHHPSHNYHPSSIYAKIPIWWKKVGERSALLRSAGGGSRSTSAGGGSAASSGFGSAGSDDFVENTTDSNGWIKSDAQLFADPTKDESVTTFTTIDELLLVNSTTLTSAGEEKENRSLASQNAFRMGPGRSVRSKTTVRRYPPTLNLGSVAAGGSTASQYNSGGSGALPSPVPLVSGSGGMMVPSSPYYRAPGSRPHSYHQGEGGGHQIVGAASSAAVNAKNLGGIGLKNNNRLYSRPHSYHDGTTPGAATVSSHHEFTTGAGGGGSTNLMLPVTPTRRSFPFFSTPLSSSANFTRLSSSNHSVQNNNSPSNSMNILYQQPALTNNNQQPNARSSQKKADMNLEDLLGDLSLHHYVGLFKENEVDMETLPCLSDADLRELGVQEAKSRALIMKYAKLIQVS